MKLSVLPCLLALTGAANAECADFDLVRKGLAERFSEVPVFAGQSAGAGVVVFAAPDGRTFTVLVVKTDGKACLIASGDGWSMMLPEQKHKGEDG